MHPIERLRYVARAGDGEPGFLAREAVRALGDLARDPRALVMSGVRLVAAQPSCGPLWWGTSRVLAAPDPHDEERAVIEALESDFTAEELASAYPGTAVVACAAGPTILASLTLRPDLVARVVGEPWQLGGVLRELAGECEASGWLVEESAGACAGADVCCVEALAAGPDGALVDRGSALLGAAALRAGVPVWLVAGVGCVLPAALFDAAVRRCTPAEPGATPVAFLLGAASVDCVVGPWGRERTDVGLRRDDCPVAAELTR